MSFINHIAFGILFTAIFCSLFDINIFHSPWLLSCTALFSILPDIDHTKGISGRLCYPISYYIGKNYGHRTITHSLAFYVFGVVLTYLVSSVTTQQYTVVLVYSLAYFSHLLLDMMTVQGVPLLYPLMRNRFVIPGDRELRFNSGDARAESAFFAITIVVGLCCQNLFVDGFWTTYNRSFRSVRHLKSEYLRSSKLISTQYSVEYNGKKEQGSGYMIGIHHEKAVIYDTANRRMLHLSTKAKCYKLLYKKTDMGFSVKEVSLNKVTISQLRAIAKQHPIIYAQIHFPNGLRTYRYVLSADIENEYIQSDTDEYNRQIVEIRTKLTGCSKYKEALKAQLCKVDLFEREEITKRILEIESKESNLQLSMKRKSDLVKGLSAVRLSGVIRYIPVSL